MSLAVVGLDNTDYEQWAKALSNSLISLLITLSIYLTISFCLHGGLSKNNLCDRALIVQVIGWKEISEGNQKRV